MAMKLHSRAIIRLRGQGADNFLHGLVTQDVKGKVSENPTRSFAAGFLNAKGRVLCDSIIFPRSPEEFYLDIHESLLPSMHRLLLRHKLRLPLEIDLAPDWNVVWDQDSTPSSSSSGSPSREEDQDPRHKYLGGRRVIPAEEAQELGAGDEAFFKRRLLCGIPEGPSEILPGKALPLAHNFDLNNFISFRKGCYVGQELTHRSFHVGKVRKRLCRVIMSSKDFPADQPVPEDIINPADALPLNGADGEDNELFVPGQKEGQEWKSVGEIITSHQNIGLAMFATQDCSLNERKGILQAMQGHLYFRGEKLLLKPPVLSAEEENTSS